MDNHDPMVNRRDHELDGTNKGQHHEKGVLSIRKPMSVSCRRNPFSYT